MAKSMIDKYRQILAADPGSMVFVELAKAHLDQGAFEEAIEVGRAGLEHHPDSIVGHVLWGRALIGLGRPDEAMDQFEEAIGLDPENPYAYNLIGEVLLHRQLYRSAIPILRKAVTLQPGDGRVRQWLEQAERAIRRASSEDRSAAEPAAHPREETAPAGAPGDDTTRTGALDDTAAAALDAAFDQVAAASPGDDDPDGDPTEIALPALSGPPADPAAAWGGSSPADPFAAALGEEPGDDILPGMTGAFQALGQQAQEAAGPRPDPTSPWADEAAAAAGSPPGAALTPSLSPDSPEAWQDGASSIEISNGFDTSGSDDTANDLDAPVVPGGPGLDDPTVFTGPPPIPPPLPKKTTPPPQAAPEVLFGLELPPPPSKAGARAGAAQKATTPPPDEREARRMAEKYEAELRQKMMPGADSAAQKARRRKVIFTVSGVVAVLLLAAGGVGAYYGLNRSRAEHVRAGLEAARNGMARDRYASYRAALGALDEVEDRDPTNLEARAMRARIEALLWAGFDHDPRRREAAEAILADEAVASAFPDAILDARYLLASADDKPKVGEEALVALEQRPDSAALQHLAGLHLLAKGDADAATGHFKKVLDLAPGHVRTVMALGDHFAGLGHWEEALRYYDNVRNNFENHVRASVGAARARLAMGRETDEALATVLRLEEALADEISEDEKVEVILVSAALLAAKNRSEQAIARLVAAEKDHPGVPAIPAQLAELHHAGFRLDAALPAVERALSMKPDDLALRRLEASILVDWSRYTEAVARIDQVKEPDAGLWLVRGIAAYHAGDLAAARKSLDKTRNAEGRMPADAAIYLALVDLASKEEQAAKAVLNRAAKASDQPLVKWALGRWYLETGDLRRAGPQLEKAAAAAPRSFRVLGDLGRAAVARGKQDEALAHFGQAVEIDPFFIEGLSGLAEAYLALGEHEPARDVAKRILTHRPDDASAHRQLALAQLGLGNLVDAETHAKAARTGDKGDPRNHHVLGRVLRAQDNPRQAVKVLLRARRLAPEDPAVLTDLGLALLSRGNRTDPRKARGYFEAALEKDKTHAAAQWGLGRAHLAERDARNAVQVLGRAARVMARAGTPEDQCAVWLDLARAHLLGGQSRDLRNARKAAYAAIKAKDGAEPRELLGSIWLEDGKAAAARRELERAISLDEKRTSALFLLGRAAAETKDADAAKTALERYLELEPKGAHVKDARRLLADVTKG